MGTFNHAFSLAFSVPGSAYEVSEQTVFFERDLVIRCLLLRIAEIVGTDHEALVEALGPAWDSFEEVP